MSFSESSASPAPALTLRLPNARAGEAYAQLIAPPGGVGEEMVLSDIRIPAELDMTVDAASGRISGIPRVPGEYTIDLRCRGAGAPENQSRQLIVQLLVNPDPKSLWQNKPSDRQAPYWRADEDCASLRGPQMRIVAASKRGRSHAHVGSFRDDDVRIGMVAEAGWYIAVVADGAGSAKFSREGAALICQVARDRLSATLAGPAGRAIDSAAQACHDATLAGADEAQLDPMREQLRHAVCGVVGNTAWYAASAIMDECNRREADLQAAFRDYASTAQIAVCKRYPFGTLCAAYWVGDGAVAIYSKNDGVKLLGDIDSGEYAGQTRFLDSSEVTQEALSRRTRVEIVTDMTALVLMTDGVSDPKFDTEARLGRAADWDALWNDLDQAVGLGAGADGQETKLLAWLDFWSQGNHDDRTIAIIQ